MIRIRTHTHEFSNEWDDALPYALFAINQQTSDTTGFSANLLMFGRELRLPQDLSFTYPIEGEQTQRNYFIRLRQYFTIVHDVVRTNIKRAQDAYSKQYDKTVNNFTPEVGDQVLRINRVHLEGQAPKLAVVYRGPYTVLETQFPNVKIESNETNEILTVHVNELRPYHNHAVLSIRERPRRLIVPPGRHTFHPKRVRPTVRRRNTRSIKHRCQRCGRGIKTVRRTTTIVRRGRWTRYTRYSDNDDSRPSPIKKNQSSTGWNSNRNRPYQLTRTPHHFNSTKTSARRSALDEPISQRPKTARKFHLGRGRPS